MWLLCTNGVLDVVDFFGNGCEKFPLPLGHGLLMVDNVIGKA
jgi:hypothetical protein